MQSLSRWSSAGSEGSRSADRRERTKAGAKARQRARRGIARTGAAQDLGRAARDLEHVAGRPGRIGGHVHHRVDQPVGQGLRGKRRQRPPRRRLVARRGIGREADQHFLERPPIGVAAGRIRPRSDDGAGTGRSDPGFRLGRKRREQLSAKTNAETLDAARSELVRKVKTCAA